MRTVFLLSLAMALPLSAWAATDDFISSKLSNQSKHTLKQVATWGNNCIVDKKKLAKTLTPGASTILKVKSDCDWAGVRYKIIGDKKNLGYVGYAFRNNAFSWDVAKGCKDGECAFTGLPPAKKTKR